MILVCDPSMEMIPMTHDTDNDTDTERDAEQTNCWFMACENEIDGSISRELPTGEIQRQWVCAACAESAIRIGNWDHFSPDDGGPSHE